MKNLMFAKHLMNGKIQVKGAVSLSTINCFDTYSNLKSKYI